MLIRIEMGRSSYYTIIVILLTLLIDRFAAATSFNLTDEAKSRLISKIRDDFISTLVNRFGDNRTNLKSFQLEMIKQRNAKCIEMISQESIEHLVAATYNDTLNYLEDDYESIALSNRGDVNDEKKLFTYFKLRVNSLKIFINYKSYQS